jgi:hypothetical protein
VTPMDSLRVALRLASLAFVLALPGNRPAWPTNRVQEREAKMDKTHANLDEQARRDLAVGLVDGAVETAGKLDPESQALLLNRAGQAISLIDAEKAKGFWEAAFRLSQHLEGTDSNRSIRWETQLSVVTEYAHVDVDRSLELLREMDPPVLGEPLDYDPRGNGAFVVVNCLIERHAEGDLDKSRGTIAYMADTGEYPYISAAPVVEAFHKKGQDSRATEIFAEALGHFQKDTRFRDSLESFIGLIFSSDGKVPDHLLRDGIRLAVGEARRRDEEAAKQPERKPTTYVLPSFEKGPLRFRTQSTCTAFRLLPLARRLDAELARQMEEDDAELKALLGQITPEDVAARSSYTPQEVSSPQDEARLGPPLNKNQMMGTMKSILQSVYPDAEINAPGAVEGPVSDEVRLRFLVGIAGGVGKGNAEKGAALMHEAESLLEKVNDPEKKARVLIEMAEAWAMMKDSKRATADLDAAFRLLMDLYRKSVENLPDAYQRLLAAPGYSLYRIAYVETSFDPQQAARRAEAIPDAWWRATYQLAVGEFIFKHEKGMTESWSWW